jgi:AraC family transcriptional regulator of adaptative response / DNA-3-methyladenine glycosylase II
MNPNAMSYYNAYLSRDPRFDGVFYIGVTSTGIYCRPICTAKTPKERNCRYFNSAEAAEKASFRPCLRCRPELAPGNAPIDGSHRIANLIVQRIEEGMVDDNINLAQIADQFGLSSRQIRRVIQKELGVSPIELIQTRRLLLAKHLLTETTLPIIQVAFASGFGSLRRFNTAFSTCYGMPPTKLRKALIGKGEKQPTPATITLQLSYRPPYDWDGVLKFLSLRMLKSVEHVDNHSYYRTIQLGKFKGWIIVRNKPQNNTLTVEIAHSLTPALPCLLNRLQNVFDLSARPDVINEHLMNDLLLAPAIANNPGLRVPGAFDGFELAVRAILGQQITVKAATTLAGRLVNAFGEVVETPYAQVSRLCPPPEKIATLQIGDLAALGIIQTRAKSIIILAQEVASGRLRLDVGFDPEAIIRQLIALPGIGAWTANYIAIRALRWPDAFPKEDLVLRQRLGRITAAQAEIMSQKWRPWRSYATLHLWQNLVSSKT